jgi:tryptophan synthase alpha chain
MNRIERCFQELSEQGKKGFVAYIGAGDPSLAATVELVIALAEAGADVVELGIPFSDPLADGLVNQLSAQRALEAGADVHGILRMVSEIRARGCEVPICFFTYFNPVYHYGLERFAKDAAAAGADGILTLDVPVEEGADYVIPFREQGISTVFLIAPTSPEERIERIVKRGTGFIYYVSREGVTGERSEVASGVQDQIEKIRKHTSLPIAVGFGVSTPEQARVTAAMGDAVVVGSAIVRRIADGDGSPEHVASVAEFVRSLATAVHEQG